MQVLNAVVLIRISHSWQRRDVFVDGGEQAAVPSTSVADLKTRRKWKSDATKTTVC